MTKTVVGLFKTINEAQSVKQELVNKGYSPETITVMSSDAKAGHGKVAAAETGIGEKISSFFRSFTSGDEKEEGYYAKSLDRGGAIIAVTIPEQRAEQVADLLADYGATGIDEQQAATASTATGSARQAQDHVAIPVVEEEMQIGKREVRRGGVRVYSNLTEHPVEAKVKLREEHVHVERRPVDRPATEADFNTGRNQSIELTETAEEAVVGKTSRVVEEVVVGKDTTERTQTIKDKVRKTEVKVEQVGGSESIQSYSHYEPEFRKDFQSKYAKGGSTYEHYAPAYQYGHKLASDPRYTTSEWSSIEPTAKSDWSREGKGSWEDFKAAIRSGWDRVRGR